MSLEARALAVLEDALACATAVERARLVAERCGDDALLKARVVSAVRDDGMFEQTVAIKLIVRTSSRIPRTIQTRRGHAPKDGRSPLNLSNMKSLMTPDDTYRSAATIWNIHYSMLNGYAVG